MKAILIEDEIPARITLKGYLDRYYPFIEVVAEIKSVSGAMSTLSKLEADILFVDIHLKDGLALEILKAIEPRKFRVIFTTAYEDYSMEAFKYKGFGYLLKPLDPLDFKEIMDRVINDINAKKPARRIIEIPIPNGKTWLDVAEIVRCESHSNYTTLYRKNGASYTFSKTLKYVEEEMISDHSFLRVHQSHLINLDYVKDREIRSGKIQLSDGTLVPVSRNKKAYVVEAFRST